MASLYVRLNAYAPRIAVVCHDLAMVWLCWYGLHRLRYAVWAGSPEYPLWSVEMLLVLVAQGLVFWRVGLYRGLWRFASFPDLLNIIKASLVGMLAIVLVLALYNRLGSVPRLVLVLYPFALCGLLGLPRLLYRAWKDNKAGREDGGTAQRVLVLGAGQAAETLLRDLGRSRAWQPVGLLDDAPRLQGTKVRGIPVLGTLAEAPRIARETAARLLVIAIPTLDAVAIQRVLAICESTGLPFRMVPRLIDVLEGRSLPGELKEVAIEDLLGRKPVMPDWKLIRGWLGARSVMVTGAGGSIGSELCHQCARHGATSLTLVEISELALIRTREGLKRSFPDLEINAILGNCGDPALIRHALRRGQPDAVFHAAAYKHVPLLEGQLREAVRNNVLVSETVARAAHEAGVGTFVLISTDKAVDPVNVLGATKRLAEMVCQRMDDGHSTRFTVVRFGNVLDSAGSVVPLFREQIRQGGPVTVTHPEVTRYFMTIPEACQLIVQAAASASHASIYTLDMGEPVPIRVLAEQMIRLAGKQPGRDVAIAYTGLRPGEKLHETLFYSDESYCPTSHSKILQARARQVVPAAIDEVLAKLREGALAYDEAALAGVLRGAIPEFEPAPASGHDAIIVPFPGKEAKIAR
ncbi:MAG: nucleoside-diphosphate sugar epimerase/dehydratase [Pseudoxanthomonas sp.]